MSQLESLNEVKLSPEIHSEEGLEPVQIDASEHHEEDEAKDSTPIRNEHLEAFNKSLEEISGAEAKLQFAIDFMEKSIAQSGTPHFKTFWQVRTLCLQMFKEPIAPALRAALWNKYSELSKEARRLKELLDEQSAFASEQIDMAIKGLEDDIAQLEQARANPLESNSTITCKALEKNQSFYQMIQNELDLLNKQASRINALRKELIKTEMRVRKKNQFFQRLSLAGDKVFPRRKDLIKEISEKFSADVDAFIAQHFSRDEFKELYFLREEIKALQGVAKALTLNTHSFTHTRLRLSECWDKIKVEEKERKKVRTQQKAVFKQNVEAVLQKVEEFNQGVQSKQLSLAEGNKKVDEIISFMRSVELGRDEVKYLKEQLNAARQPLHEMAKSEEKLRQEQENERARIKHQKLNDLKSAIHSLIDSAASLDAEALGASRDALLQKIQEASLIKAEKQELERMLKPVRDLIADKQEQALMALSDDDRQALQQLKEVLKQRKDRRQEIKDQIESLRKASGGSGLDFGQAMEYNAQLQEAKERLEKVTQGIHEIELRIDGLENK